jgi:hypothetical protein
MGFAVTGPVVQETRKHREMEADEPQTRGEECA